MNTEEVVAMIDAITDGRTFTLDVNTIEGEPSIAAKFTMDEVSIYGQGGFATAIDDPRTAREIAGALIAWANRKDGLVSWDTAKSVTIYGQDLRDAIRDKRTTSIPEELKHYGELGGTKRVGNSSYADWYRRNVENMTQETKDRNLKDLLGIQEDVSIVSEEHADICAAIDILIISGAKSDPTNHVHTENCSCSIHPDFDAGAE